MRTVVRSLSHRLWWGVGGLILHFGILHLADKGNGDGDGDALAG